VRLFSSVVLFASLLSISCSETDTGQEEMMTQAPSPQQFSFSDGFEGNEGDFNALFPQDGSRWSNIQLVNPANKENNIGLTNETVSEGQYALSLFSVGSDETLSKIDLEKGGLAIFEGQTVSITANFYIESDENLQGLLLVDLECCECWDPRVPDNQCPGVRLMMSGGNDFLSIERGKIGLETLVQDQVAFPRNEWVEIQWVMKLSPNVNGNNQLYVNGQLVIDEINSNMPNEDVFEGIFAEKGIDFQLQTPVFYERVQIGATANPTTADIPIYIDGFSLQVMND
jgi:hypothetical protein